MCDRSIFYGRVFCAGARLASLSSRTLRSPSFLPRRLPRYPLLPNRPPHACYKELQHGQPSEPSEFGDLPSRTDIIDTETDSPRRDAGPTSRRPSSSMVTITNNTLGLDVGTQQAHRMALVRTGPRHRQICPVPPPLTPQTEFVAYASSIRQPVLHYSPKHSDSWPICRYTQRSGRRRRVE